MMNKTNTEGALRKSSRLKKSFVALAISAALAAGCTYMPPYALAYADSLSNGDSDKVVESISAEASTNALASTSRTFTTDLDFDSLVAAKKEERRANAIESLAAMAKAQIGVPYSYGGTTPRGFDCSGFVGYVVRNTLGITIPRTAAGQSSLGSSVPLSQAQCGDLVFWGGRRGVYHVGISLGNGSYIHSSSSRGVTISNIGTYSPSFAKHIDWLSL